MFMKNIIPFKKDVIFKTNISEITSISLEHTLSVESEKIKGDFILTGDYKISENSTTVEPFDLKIPFEISLDERFDTSKATLDIDDFFYEIVNNSVLSLSIDVLVDKLEEKEIIEEDFDIEEPIEVKKEIEILNKDDREIIEENIDVKEKIDSLFNTFSSESDEFVTYSICIIRDGDTIESIMDKYGVGEDLIKEYNNLKDLKVGDKLIIPNINETN